MAVALALSASAAAPQTRATGRSAGALKALNTSGHALAARTAEPARPMRAESDAPANAVEVPFTHTLAKNASENQYYTIFDANNDSRGWKVGGYTTYTACMLPNSADINAADDWLFSMPVHLPAGDYVVSYKLGILGTTATGVEMNVTLGTAPTVEAATIAVSPKTKYTVKDMTVYEHNVSVNKEGYYYLGFHCTTPESDKGTLKLADVGMRSGSVVTVDPPAAGTLTWTLAPKGELKATVVYTAPTLTKGGKELTEITKVEITSRWGVDKFTYDNVTPGQVITIEDVEMYQGINNRFTGVAYVGDVKGDMVEHKSIWCGADTPLAPENVKLTVNPGYTTATLSWDAVPETGEHGGYVDPEQVTYYIFDAFGNYYDPALYTTSQTSQTIDYADKETQDFYAYQVTAGFGEKYSLDNTSNIITAGTPDALPKRESFTGGIYDDLWLGNTAVKGNMQYGTITDDYFASLVDPEDPEAPAPLTSQDGDKGFYYWMPFEKDVAYGLISTRADISKAAGPVLEFWHQGQGSLIEVYVGTEIGAMAKAATVDMQANPTSGWTLARLPLDDYKALGAVMFEIRFVAAHNDDEHIWSVPLDNVCVRDLTDNDVRLVTFDGTQKANPGETLNFTAHIQNNGITAAAPVARWTVNGDVALTETLAEINPDGFADASFQYTVPFNAPETLEVSLELDLQGDSAPADNTASSTVAVKRVNYATVADLAAVQDGSNVVLTWSHPVNESDACKTVTDDFESEDYTPMSISGAGGWTVYDGDGEKTYNIFRELYNPYQTQPIGFQLFDNIVAQVPDNYMADAEAYSGQRFMIAPSAQRALNDNWLISPALSGNAQTVGFMAKSFSRAWPETIEIYYSTTDNAPESFTEKVSVIDGLADSREVPEVWTKFTFSLPEGAKYFAIHHDAYDSLALLIDDVTYEAAPSVPADLTLSGYHVYRDGKALTDDLHTDNTYIDTPANDESHTFEYTVVPVYNYGVAAESNKATIFVEKSGIENVAVPADGSGSYYDLRGIKYSDPRGGIFIRVNNGKAVKTVK